MKKIRTKIAVLVCGIGLLTTITATNVSARGMIYCFDMCGESVECHDFGGLLPGDSYFFMQDLIDLLCAF